MFRTAFVEAWLYQLPYGTGRRWGSAVPQFMRQAVGGWNLSGAIRLASGMPLWAKQRAAGSETGNKGLPTP